MDTSEAVFNIEFGKHCSAAEFMGEFIQCWGHIVLPDVGLISVVGV